MNCEGDAHLLQEGQHLINGEEIRSLPAFHLLDAAPPARLRARPLAPEAEDEDDGGGCLNRRGLHDLSAWATGAGGLFCAAGPGARDRDLCCAHNYGLVSVPV